MCGDLERDWLPQRFTSHFGQLKTEYSWRKLSACAHSYFTSRLLTTHHVKNQLGIFLNFWLDVQWVDRYLTKLLLRCWYIMSKWRVRKKEKRALSVLHKLKMTACFLHEGMKMIYRLPFAERTTYLKSSDLFLPNIYHLGAALCELWLFFFKHALNFSREKRCCLLRAANLTRPQSKLCHSQVSNDFRYSRGLRDN